jgi:hypothetical protein
MTDCVGRRALLLCAFALAMTRSLAAPAPVAAPATGLASVVESLDACAAALDREVDVGFERIAARCPGLPGVLARSGVDRWLPGGWREGGNDLSAGSLEELRTLLQRELPPRPAERTPDVRRLRQVLTEIGPAGAARGGLLARVRDWLRRIGTQNAEPGGPGWLTRTVSRIGLPQTLLRLVTYASLAALVVLALLILANEVRAAGVLRRRIRAALGAAAIEHNAERPLSWQDVDRAAPAARPGLLLELILERLSRWQGLRSARSRTVGELKALVSTSRPEDGMLLSELAATAERVRYGAGAASPVELAGAIDAGRALFERIEAAATMAGHSEPRA